MTIQYPLLVDGGLSYELERKGCDLNHRLWSAHLLDTNPEAIIQAHLAYLEAGAQCIITSSYQASILGFKEAGFDQDYAISLILKSVTLAEEAITRHMDSNPDAKRPLIAASIGPYGAYRADGSEYHGDYGLSDRELYDFHFLRMTLLDNSNADFFACETIPGFQEAKVLANLLLDTSKPAWISFSCKDGLHINDGTPIAECAVQLAAHPKIFAIGVNCTAPRYISGLIQSLKSVMTNKKIVVYPNSGEVFNAQNKTWSGISDPNTYVHMVKEWIELGADIIGGCCRIGPEHVRSVKGIVYPL